ncbi:unnamed protein product [Vicia faba]|uniref:DUF4283 domain-containing protein n=2 Tax=Vicia faba TaxID=3906 RepID=A0AAV0ZIX1_VICFA|nr:unnamed protein product [Vicia faba]
MVPPPPEPINCSPPKTALVSPAEKVHQASTSKEKEKEDDADFKPIETLDPKLEGVRKLWVDALNDNRNPAKERSIKFIVPKMVNGEIEVKIEEDDVISEVIFWKPSLVLYTLGGELSMNAVKNFMIKHWNFVQLSDMYYHEEGYFILRFKMLRERDDVLMKGPYMFISMSLLIREWRLDFNLKDDMLRTLPIWVKLPQLPLFLWGENSLNKIGSALGNPIVTDECTGNRLHVSYARILVKMDITNEHPKAITIRDSDGEKMQQAIEYEWKPILCGKCQKIGHNCDKPKGIVKEYKPKPKTPEDNKTVSSSNIVKAGRDEIIGKDMGGTETTSTTGNEIEKWTEAHKSGKARGK